MICLETKAWSGERGFNRERKRKGRKTRERRRMLEGKEKILKGVKWRAKRLSGKFGVELSGAVFQMGLLLGLGRDFDLGKAQTK